MDAKDHDTDLTVKFDCHEIRYARGVQKDRTAKIHRCTEGI